jgi:hypothetical protein
MFYNAVNSAIATVLLGHKLERGHLEYLTDRLLQIILNWLSHNGLFPPGTKMMTQQKHIIQFLMKMTSTTPIDLIAPIFQIQQELSRLQQINNLNRYE